MTNKKLKKWVEIMDRGNGMWKVLEKDLEKMSKTYKVNKYRLFVYILFGF